MTPKIKNAIIFAGIAVALVLIYIFFIRPSSDQANLVSVPAGTGLPDMSNSGANPAGLPNGNPLPQDFLTLLLSVNNIKLDDSIFSDPAFKNLHDSSITLTAPGTEGRPNPFAQFGNDLSAPPVLTPANPNNTQL